MVSSNTLQRRSRMLAQMSDKMQLWVSTESCMSKVEYLEGEPDELVEISSF